MEEKILATLNGRSITERDLEETICKFPQDKQGYLRTEQGKKQLLEELVCFELVYDYAKETGMENDKVYIDQIQKVKKEVLTQITMNKILAEVTVNDNDLKDYYEKNKDMFKNQESIKASHILVETEEEANKTLDEINKGMSFEDAAKKYSTCPSKSEGGSLGSFTRGKMVPEFENAAFDLEVGVVSKPVKTQFGYHLIKVEEKNPSSVKAFEEVKQVIENQLKQVKQREKYVKFTNELKEKYNLQIK